MIKKYVILGLLIVSIISVCPLPLDSGNYSVGMLNFLVNGDLSSSTVLFYNQLMNMIQSLSIFNYVFYTIILVGFIYYFYNDETSDNKILKAFIVTYVLILIINSQGTNMSLMFYSSKIIGTLYFIFTLILALIITVLFIILVKDNYKLDFKTPIILSTLAVFTIQAVIMIYFHLFTINSKIIDDNIINFLKTTSIISLVVITIMKILIILEIVNFAFLEYIEDEENELI